MPRSRGLQRRKVASVQRTNRAWCVRTHNSNSPAFSTCLMRIKRTRYKWASAMSSCRLIHEDISQTPTGWHFVSLANWKWSPAGRAFCATSVGQRAAISTNDILECQIGITTSAQRINANQRTKRAKQTNASRSNRPTIYRTDLHKQSETSGHLRPRHRCAFAYRVLSIRIFSMRWARLFTLLRFV